jgi:hypothetical protein
VAVRADRQKDVTKPKGAFRDHADLLNDGLNEHFPSSSKHSVDFFKRDMGVFE